MCTATALLVSLVIAVLFLSAFLRFDASVPVALLFIAAMLAFFLGLLWFLREIFVATKNLRIASKKVHGRSIGMWALVMIALGVAAPLQKARISLPAGVKSVSFGQAQRYRRREGAVRHRSPSRCPSLFASGVKEICTPSSWSRDS